MILYKRMTWFDLIDWQFTKLRSKLRHWWKTTRFMKHGRQYHEEKEISDWWVKYGFHRRETTPNIWYSPMGKRLVLEMPWGEQFEGKTFQEVANAARRSMAERTVHILQSGLPLCEFTTDVPRGWPDGHLWVGIEKSDISNCSGCKDKLPKEDWVMGPPHRKLI